MIGPLIFATLKSFLRSRKTLLILFVLPLLLIASIFLSFHPDGLQSVPAGVVLNSGLEFSDAQELFPMLDLTVYEDAESCLSKIRSHESYVCLNVYGSEQVTIELFYDNTREPVIWEVINLIDHSVRQVQRERSAIAAESLFASLDSVEEYLEAVAEKSDGGRDRLVGFEQEVNVLKNDLRSSRLELSDSLTDMDRDLDESRTAIRDARRSRNDALGDLRDRIDEVEDYVDALASIAPNASMLESEVRSEIHAARRDIDEFEEESDAQFDSFEDSISISELRVAQGRVSVADMSRNEARLDSVVLELRTGQQEFSELSRSTDELDSVFEENTISSDSIINSVRMTSIPVYVPSGYGDGGGVSTAQGFTLLSYQTLFPSLLMLVALFFGLLLSTFMTITYIKTPAYMRLRLVQGSWLSDFVAMLVSSVLIASVSVGLVFGLGVILFQIPLEGIGEYAVLLFGIVSVLALIGIAIVHLVWSESMSIIVSMFVLVSLLFSSGFVLPIERMSPWASYFASVNPITIGLDAFDRIVFYGLGVSSSDWTMIAIWLSMLSFGVIITRLLSDQ